MFLQYCLDGLTNGSLFALIALGYTMVYGIIELINFAHGDVFMLGSFLAFTLVGAAGAERGRYAGLCGGLALVLLRGSAVLRGAERVDRSAGLQAAPPCAKLAPLVSAIGVSFVLMNIGLLWKGAADLDFPALIPQTTCWAPTPACDSRRRPDGRAGHRADHDRPDRAGEIHHAGQGHAGDGSGPDAARLMGINVDRVIGATFVIGGALAGAASVIYGLYIHTIGYQMGFQNGLYAFTAAVLGGIGNIPGAVLGGLVIGLVRSLGSGYVGERGPVADLRHLDRHSGVPPVGPAGEPRARKSMSPTAPEAASPSWPTPFGCPACCWSWSTRCSCRWRT